MKTLLILPLLAIVIASCSKNDTTSDPLADLTAKNSMVIQSDWIVTQFTDSGSDQTSSLQDYKFKFSSDGAVQAVSADSIFSGTWALALPSSKSDDSGNDATDDKFNKFTISISGSSPLDHLTHKWLIEKITATEIWLRDDNVASKEILRFGK